MNVKLELADKQLKIKPVYKIQSKTHLYAFLKANEFRKAIFVDRDTVAYVGLDGTITVMANKLIQLTYSEMFHFCLNKKIQENK